MNRTWRNTLAGACGVLLFAAASHGAATAAGQAGLDRLKELAGDWTVTGGPEGVEGSIVSYRVTGGGSTVVETMFGGTDHEMITVYHLDGDDLVLTHYCAAGNQPRMKAARSDDADRLEFRFDGGTNVHPKKGFHMHNATITFKGPDAVRAEWEAFKDGATDHVGTFDLSRRKP